MVKNRWLYVAIIGIMGLFLELTSGYLLAYTFENGGGQIVDTETLQTDQEWIEAARSYGQTDGANHNYLRRLADKIDEGGDISSWIADIQACFAQMDALTMQLRRAKDYVEQDPTNPQYRYLNELIEKIESNHGFGLPAGTLDIIMQDIDTAITHLDNPVSYDSIQSGQRWYDNNGSAISAYGGNVIKIGDIYYWYGEDNRLSYDLRTGVTCYSSTDLYNWTYEGIALSVFDMPSVFYTDAINQTKGRVERPKVIYNESTGKYVMWMHLEMNGHYGLAAAGVAISDNPTGPFEFLHYGRPVMDTSLNIGTEEKSVSKQTFRDMNLFIDTGNDVNGDLVDDAYTIYSSEENNTLYIARLNSDYTWVDISDDDAATAPGLGSETYNGSDNDYEVEEPYRVPSLTDQQLYAYVNYQDPEVIVHENGVWTRHRRDNQREAPAPFKYGDDYYIITSGATGWNANAANYYRSDTILGPYTNMGNPAVGEGANTTFISQSTAVMTLDADSGHYVYMGDRWKNGDYSNGDVKSSTYVWLPLEFDEDGALTMRWYEEWGYDILGKSVQPFEDRIVYLDESAVSLPEQAELLEVATGARSYYDVIWDEPEEIYHTPGIYDVKGDIPALNHIEVGVRVWVIDSKTAYFINANYAIGDGSQEYDAIINALLSKDLLQGNADQRFGQDMSSGYAWGSYNPIGSTVRDASDPYRTLHYRSETAPSGEADNGFGYRMELPEGEYDVIMGFYIPSTWNGRTFQVEVGDNQQWVTLESGVPQQIQLKTIQVTDDDYDLKGLLDVYMRKEVADGSNYTDPMMSWLMVVPSDGEEGQDELYDIIWEQADDVKDSGVESIDYSITIQLSGNQPPSLATLVLQVKDINGQVVAIERIPLGDDVNRTLAGTIILPNGSHPGKTIEAFVVDQMEATTEGFDSYSQTTPITLNES